ncbi:MAG: CDP-diacylglycerol--glycerol-3-phosphate 3-phosphatidyltransferase [Proteobacteria bacterium]|nr:CDP-diacylglycerol--glycerol-3-phosphate 3-phosphatidyltransferase [Pseudomonadota bacterium]|tara:strand:+ start:91 stop:687 length:597 start_codon:yes stop_codon:yes gene_type:complete
MLKNLPNTLTWSRIFLIPILVIIFYLPESLIGINERDLLATLVFLIAAATDWLDGFIARKFNLVSSFGAFLDPVADKLMVSTALVILVWLGRVEFVVAAVIIGREVGISALREWMAIIGESVHVSVSILGKIKTTTQMIAIPFLLYNDHLLNVDTRALGNVLIWVATALTIWSMLYYLHRARKTFKTPEKEKGKEVTD